MDSTCVELNSEYKGSVCPLATLVIAGYLKEGRSLGSGLHIHFALFVPLPQGLPVDSFCHALVSG